MNSDYLLHEIDYKQWVDECIEHTIKDVDRLVRAAPEGDRKNTEAIKSYWTMFAQYSVDLNVLMGELPEHHTSVMMMFRLLQETSADIYYLKNHINNIGKLTKANSKIKRLVSKNDLTLRSMAKVIKTTDIRKSCTKKRNKDNPQARIRKANSFLDKNFGTGMTKSFRTVNEILNGYTHFNPAAMYIQSNFNDHGYLTSYMRILQFYPGWLFLVLVSLSDLLDISELDEKHSKEIAEQMFLKIKEHEKWKEIEFISKKQK